MNVRWTPAAKQDRIAIFDYLEARDPDAAVRMDDRFGDVAGKLADFPKMGHPDEVPGTRELHPHRSYRLVYGIVDDTVWILPLVHSARDWPPAAR